MNQTPIRGSERAFHDMISGIVKEPVDTGGRFVHTSWPQQLVVELTSACNQGCVFCGRTYMKRAKGHMARAIFNRIVEQMGAESPYTELWPAFMGESMLLGRELFDRLRYAREVGCRKITLNTNGTLLNDKNIPRVLEGNWDRMIVSCDANTDETHALLRPGRKTQGLTGIYAAMLKLIGLMRERGLSRPIIEMQFSIFAENEHEVKTSRRSGWNKVSWSRLGRRSTGRAWSKAANRGSPPERTETPASGRWTPRAFMRAAMW